MKRSFLTALGIEKEQIDQIMAEHGNTVEVIKEKAKEDAEKQAEKLNNKIAALQEKIDSMPEPSGEDLQAKLDALQAKYDTDIASKDKALSDYKSTVEAEKSTATKREALRKQLAADGANQKLIGLLEKEFDLSAIELDGEKISKWNELSKSVKENYADVFGTVQTKGADVADPPTSNQSSYSVDDIKKMTPAQINANWDKGVKQALEKGK